jgi:phage shock protein A
MGIFDRMGRVISSNFNALLDGLDDPRKSIDSIIDGMNEQLAAARREVVSAVASEKQLKEKVATLDAEVQKWESRAELALKRNDEALAREALSQKLRLVAERDRAEAMRAEQRAEAVRMRDELPRMEAKIKEFTLRKATIATKAKMARSGGGTESLGAPGTGPRPFDELRRMEDQIEGIEASVQAQRELDVALGDRGPSGLGAAELEAKFRELEKGSGTSAATPDLDEELRSLKEKIRIG